MAPAAQPHQKNTQAPPPPPPGVVYRRIFVKIFISASGFCRHNKLHKIKSDWISATSCDKILLWRRSSQKFSSTHKAFFHCNVSHNLSPDLNTRSYLLLRCVTATCSHVYPNLWSLESQAQLPLFWHRAATHPPLVMSGPGLSSSTWHDGKHFHFFWLPSLGHGQHPLSHKNLVGTF